MDMGEAVRIALRGLRAHRLRTALTTLGIMIGVAAVILLVALGNGMQDQFAKEFGALANQVTITKLTGEIPGAGKPRNLTNADVNALRNPAKAPHLAAVTPVISGTTIAFAGSGAGKYRISIIGTTPDYLAVTNRRTITGAMFTEAQFQAKARVAVLGPEAVAKLFDGDAEAAIGKPIRIGRAKFTVIGVVKGNGEQDDAAIMPFGAARAHLIGGTEVNQITAKAPTVDTVDLALEQVNKILTARHNIRDPEKRDFDAKSFGTLLEESNKFFSYLTIFMIGIAAISLVVGGIGVANIMLVTVTERTREIGLRKALGARRGTILKQFLIESVTLASIGGIVGVLAGVGTAMAAAELLPALADDFPTPRVSPGSIVVSLGISVAIGILAGGYPARRAARMHPIQALRYE